MQLIGYWTVQLLSNQQQQCLKQLVLKGNQVRMWDTHEYELVIACIPECPII